MEIKKYLQITDSNDKYNKDPQALFRVPLETLPTNGKIMIIIKITMIQKVQKYNKYNGTTDLFTKLAQSYIFPMETALGFCQFQ